MSRIPSMKHTLVGGLALALGGGLGLTALAQYGAAPPPPPPPGQPPAAQDEADQRHTAVVVDLMSYLEAQEEQRGAPGAPGSPRMQADPGSGAPPTPPPPPPPPDDPPQPPDPPAPPDRPQDDAIDWSEIASVENLEAGVPVVLMIEEERRWGPSEHHAYVVAFDPNDGDSQRAYEQLVNAAGEEIEVVGETHKEGTLRGLRAFTLKRVE